jgi:hypothetical protein
MQLRAEGSTLVMPYASIEVDPRAPDTAVSSVLIEAKLVWAGDVLAVAHVRPRALVRVRDLGLDVPAGHDLVVAHAEIVNGRIVDAGLVLPNGVCVPGGHRMSVRIGRAILKLAFVEDDAEIVPRFAGDRRTAYGILGAAALHLVALGLVVHGRAPDNATDEVAMETMKGYLAAAEARANAELAQAMAAAPPNDVEGGSTSSLASHTPGKQAPKPDEGTAGDPSRVKEGARARVTRGSDTRAAKPDDRALAASFGLLSILGADKTGQEAGSSPWAADTGRAAMGNIWGTRIDDAAGAAGLSLSGAGSGAGEGGGFTFESAGSDEGGIGTIGHGHGTGYGVGYASGDGNGHGRIGGTHVVKSPSIRCGEDPVTHKPGCSTQVNGRLPPEAVQRVVRASFGRLRGCYEQGIQRNPDLEGRIAVKFVIDREGQVAMTSVEDRTLPDDSVAKCVARAYEAMTFPKPEGGIVTVVYPVVFSRD